MISYLKASKCCKFSTKRVENFTDIFRWYPMPRITYFQLGVFASTVQALFGSPAVGKPEAGRMDHNSPLVSMAKAALETRLLIICKKAE